MCYHGYQIKIKRDIVQASHECQQHQQPLGGGGGGGRGGLEETYLRGRTYLYIPEKRFPVKRRRRAESELCLLVSTCAWVRSPEVELLGHLLLLLEHPHVALQGLLIEGKVQPGPAWRREGGGGEEGKI